MSRPRQPNDWPNVYSGTGVKSNTKVTAFITVSAIRTSSGTQVGASSERRDADLRVMIGTRGAGETEKDALDALMKYIDSRVKENGGKWELYHS